MSIAIETKHQQPMMPVLDGFRAIALIMVVHYHFGLYLSFVPGYNTVLNSGHLGVQLFFILSSVLLSRQFFRPDAFQGPKLLVYVQRRLLRILPLFYISSFLLVCIGYSQYPLDWWEIIHYLVFLKDLYIHPVVWSLFLEMRFYLLLPPLMWLLQKVPSNWLRYCLLIFLLMLVYTYRYQVFTATGDSVQADALLYVSFIANLDCFVLGIVISYLLKEAVLSNLQGIRLYVSVVIAFLLIFLLMHLLQHPGTGDLVKIVWIKPLHSLLWAYLIFTCMRTQVPVLNSFLSHPILLKLSALSYSIYIWHVPVRAYMLQLSALLFQAETPLFYLLQFVLSWTVTLLLSYVSHRFIEKPFLSQKRS